MRNIRKSSTLESKFPLLAVEQGCIISKDGDITVAYEGTEKLKPTIKLKVDDGEIAVLPFIICLF